MYFFENILKIKKKKIKHKKLSKKIKKKQ